MPIASLSISGEITLNLHSLNNEGGEGNQIITRQLTIIDQGGEAKTVNGISGDMFKHIHAGHLVNNAVENNLPLSNYSRVFNPNRIETTELAEFFTNNNQPNNTSADIITGLINVCTVCDTHGILITDTVGQNRNRNVPRKSTIEFGWTVGIPGKNNSETYVHTKLVADAGTTERTGGNIGQNIFHRPANHGIYAFVCNLDIYRIGLNDINRQYAIEQPARVQRYQAIIDSLISSFLNPRGAMTSTQKPHITDFKGVVSTSMSLIPAPTISALNSDYRNEITNIANSLNNIQANSIQIHEFNGLDELVGILTNLRNEPPFVIPNAGI